MDVSDPIILTCHGGHLRAYTHTEGGLVHADIVAIDMTDVEKETTVVRIRGKLTLTCSQNETELGNVFKYLLEKVIFFYSSSTKKKKGEYLKYFVGPLAICSII